MERIVAPKAVTGQTPRAGRHHPRRGWPHPTKGSTPYCATGPSKCVLKTRTTTNYSGSIISAYYSSQRILDLPSHGPVFVLPSLYHHAHHHVEWTKPRWPQRYTILEGVTESPRFSTHCRIHLVNSFVVTILTSRLRCCRWRNCQGSWGRRHG